MRPIKWFFEPLPITLNRTFLLASILPSSIVNATAYVTGSGGAFALTCQLFTTVHQIWGCYMILMFNTCSENHVLCV